MTSAISEPKPVLYEERNRKLGVYLLHITMHGAVMNDTVQLSTIEQEALNYIVSDEALEAAADVSAMSYTHQTSAYNRCCR
jgi:hypothetical protein